MSNYNFFRDDHDAGGNPTSNEHIYFNCRIENPDYEDDNGTTDECVYQEQTQNIVEKQSDYQVAVDSWSCRASLPVFIATIKQGLNTDINALPLRVNYQYTDAGGNEFNYPTELIWTPTPSNATAPALPQSPASNNGIQDLITSPTYYHCNDYQTFVQIINTAFTTSYNAFNAVHPGIHAEPCWFQYDNRTGLFAIIAETSYASTAIVDRAEVQVDALLYKYMDTIQAEFYGYNSLNGGDYTIRFEQKLGGQNAWALGNHYAGKVVNTQTTPPAYIIMEQERDCRYLWNNIKNILVTTSSISVRDEYMPPLTHTKALVQTANRFNIDKKSILSYIDYNDNSPSQGTQSSLHRDIYYRARYHKWTDLLNDGSLNNINIEFFYETEDGFILPLRLPAKASANVKMVFRRKKQIN